MNALLSAAAGKFAKSLVLGTLLPVTLISVAFLWIVDPSVPFAAQVPSVVQGLDKEWKVALFGFVVTAIAGILYNMNSTILRFYSGYPWKDTAVGKWVIARVKAKWEPAWKTRNAQRTVAAAAKALVDAAPKGSPLQKAFADLVTTRTSLSRIVNDQYPYGAALLLPTDLGNVIRNMEDYSRARYGISAVPLWPRLVKLIDPGYAGQLDDAKTAVDFTLNLSLLCTLAASITTWLLLQAVFAGAPAGSLVSSAAKTGVFAVAAVIFYRMTIARAVEWSGLTRAAIDLFRLKLLAELGYEQKPKSRTAEREIWQQLAKEMSFADTEAPWLPYAPVASPSPVSTATALATGAKVAVRRGTEEITTVPRRFPAALVVLAVENTGSVMTDVQLTEVVPASWAFVVKSVTDSGNAFAVAIDTPLTIVLKNLAPGARRDVTYRIQSLVP